MGSSKKKTRIITIKNRLVLMLLIVSLTVLVPISLLSMYLFYNAEKRDLSDSIIAASTIISNYSAKALHSKDSQKVWNDLRVVRSLSSVSLVCMYDADDFFFSGYAIDPSISGVCPVILDDVSEADTMRSAKVHEKKMHSNPPLFNLVTSALIKMGWVDKKLAQLGNVNEIVSDNIRISYTGNNISVMSEIYDGEEYMGVLYISANMLRFWVNLWNVFLVTLLAMALSLFVTYIMASYLHRLITTPLGGLAETAEALAKSVDYDQRAEVTHIRDVNVLVHAFNSMVERIQERDRLLLLSKMAADEANESAQKASQMKSEFLANMSHELRTPLNSMLILADHFRKNKSGTLSSQQVDDAETIHGSGSDLLLIINDILDLSKVEAGKMDVHADEINIPLMLDNIQKKFRPLADSKGVGFDIEIQDQSYLYFISDKVRVEQVLRNFLSNAFKFTKSGGVTLRVSTDDPCLHGQKDSPLCREDVVAFSVIDTGIGIKEDKLDLVFEAFQQADGTTTRKFGGTGLGLSICLKFTALLGGDITLESVYGQGTTFTLFLPVIMHDVPFELADQVHAKQERVEGSGKKIQRQQKSIKAEPVEQTQSTHDAPQCDFSDLSVLIVHPKIRTAYQFSQTLNPTQCRIFIATNADKARTEIEQHEGSFDVIIFSHDVSDEALLHDMDQYAEKHESNIIHITSQDGNTDEHIHHEGNPQQWLVDTIIHITQTDKRT